MVGLKDGRPLWRNVESRAIDFLPGGKMVKTAGLMALLTLLVGCAYSTQTRYNYAEVGQFQVVEFGAVVAVRDIDIVGESSSSGGIIGGVAGGVAGGNVGKASGALAAGVAGAVIGANALSALEQAIRNRGGVEYTVTLRNGKTLTVAQNVSGKDVIHRVGDRVMVQINGQYQRVLPANSLPTEIKRPKGIEFKNE
jgi:outer membrane lipoprotein SlyB